MKKIITFGFLLMSFSVQATTDQFDTQDKIKIKEIKAYVETINPDSTCLDEYLKRRKQLIVKLSVSPLMIAAGGVSSFYGGALVGLGVAVATNASGWAPLTYAASGAVLGLGAGATGSSTNTVLAAVNLRNTNLIIQTIASQKMNIETDKVAGLYKNYLKKSDKDLSREQFLSRLLELDSAGTLCDGSLVKQPKIKFSSKLKHKVAKLKGVVLGVDS